MRKISFKKKETIFVGPKQGNCVGIYGVAVNPEKHRIYIIPVHSGKMAVIDSRTHKYLKSITLSTSEFHSHIETKRNPLNDKLYVTNAYFNCMWVVDETKDKVVRTVDIGHHPAGVDLDESTGLLYVACGEDGQVAVYDTKTDRVVDRIGVKPWPNALCVDAKNRRAYTVCQLDNLARGENFDDPHLYKKGVLSIIDIDKGKVIGEVTVGRRSRGVAVNPDTQKVYVANRADDNVLVVDAKKQRVVKELNTQCNPFGILYNPVNEQVYAVNLLGTWYDNQGQPATVTVIDTRHDQVVKHIPIGKITCQIGLDPSTNRLYTVNEDNCCVSVIDGNTDEVIDTISGPGLSVDEIAINSKTGKVYIPAHFDESCIIVDPANKGDDPLHLKINSWVTSAAANPRTDKVYVSNPEEGTVTVIDARKNKIIKDVNLGVGCILMHRCWSRLALDARRNRLYVSLPRWNGVAVIDTEEDRLLKRIKLGPPFHQDPGQFVGATIFEVRVHEGLNRVYASNPFHARFSAIDGETLEVLGGQDYSGMQVPLPVPGSRSSERRNSPFNNLAVDEGLDRVYLFGWIIDAKTLKFIGKLPDELGNGVTAVDPKRGRLFVHGREGLTVADSRTFYIIGFLPIKSTPEGHNELRIMSAIDVDRKKAYVVKNVMMEGEKLDVYDIVG